MIKNVSTGKYIDVSNGGTSTGTDCIQYGAHGAFNQQWQVRVLSDGSYTLRPMNASSESMAMGALYSTATLTLRPFGNYSNPYLSGNDQERSLIWSFNGNQYTTKTVNVLFG